MGLRSQVFDMIVVSSVSHTKVNKVVIPPEVKRESVVFREEPDGFMDALASVLLEKGLV